MTKKKNSKTIATVKKGEWHSIVLAVNFFNDLFFAILASPPLSHSALLFFWGATYFPRITSIHMLFLWFLINGESDSPKANHSFYELIIGQKKRRKLGKSVWVAVTPSIKIHRSATNYGNAKLHCFRFCVTVSGCKKKARGKYEERWWKRIERRERPMIIWKVFSLALTRFVYRENKLSASTSFVILFTFWGFVWSSLRDHLKVYQIILVASRFVSPPGKIPNEFFFPSL